MSHPLKSGRTVCTPGSDRVLTSTPLRRSIYVGISEMQHNEELKTHQAKNAPTGGREKVDRR